VYARTSALRNLHLDLDACARIEAECCDYARHLLLQIFGPCTPDRQRPKLKSLRISDMCFMLAGDLLPRLVNLEELEHLQLECCQDIDPFLRSLEPLSLSLTSVYIGTYHCPHGVVGDAMDGFLRSLQPCKRIALNFTAMNRLNERIFLQHASAIESLRLEDYDEDASPVPRFDYAPNLEQLALTDVYMESGNSQETQESMWFEHYTPLQVSATQTELKHITVRTNPISSGYAAQARAPEGAQSSQTYRLFLSSDWRSKSETF
jgi:hypothetical protein